MGSDERHLLICPPRTPGPLGLNDQGDPTRASLMGPTRGSLGLQDHGDAASRGPIAFVAPEGQDRPLAPGELSEEPVSGMLFVGPGAASVLRIPVPGTTGLAIELSPHGFEPMGGSTSTLFIQDATGKKHLRLDYGWNKNTQSINYHWNQKGTFGQFGIQGHTPVGPGKEALFKATRHFKYAGRALVVVGAVVDVVSIVVAKKRLRKAVQVVAGWAGAAAGCKAVGAGGAAVGTLVEPGGGTAVGGVAGCVVGGVGGYWGASWAAAKAYDWVEELYFEAVPETSGP